MHGRRIYSHLIQSCRISNLFFACCGESYRYLLLMTLQCSRKVPPTFNFCCSYFSLWMAFCRLLAISLWFRPLWKYHSKPTNLGLEHRYSTGSLRCPPLKMEVRGSFFRHHLRSLMKPHHLSQSIEYVTYLNWRYRRHVFWFYSTYFSFLLRPCMNIALSLIHPVLPSHCQVHFKTKTWWSLSVKGTSSPSPYRSTTILLTIWTLLWTNIPNCTTWSDSPAWLQRICCS